MWRNWTCWSGSLSGLTFCHSAKSRPVWRNLRGHLVYLHIFQKNYQLIKASPGKSDRTWFGNHSPLLRKKLHGSVIQSSLNLWKLFLGSYTKPQYFGASFETLRHTPRLAKFWETKSKWSCKKHHGSQHSDGTLYLFLEHSGAEMPQVICVCRGNSKECWASALLGQRISLSNWYCKYNILNDLSKENPSVVC